MKFKMIAVLTLLGAGYAAAQQPPVGKSVPPTPPAEAAKSLDVGVTKFPPSIQKPPVPPVPERLPNGAEKNPTASNVPPVSQPKTQLPPQNITPPSQAVDNLPPPPELSQGLDSEFPIPSEDSTPPSKSKFKRSGKSPTVKKTAADTAVVEIPERKGSDAVPPGQELVNIDFPEPTEIKDIVRAVALWMNKNVILDRNVSGKIQIISPKRVTKEEAYQAFLSALNVLQFTTVETGKLVKIVPIRQAVRGNLRTFQGSNWTPLTDEIITQIVPLKYVDARSIQNTLSRIVSTNSLIPYEKTNTLIITDSGYKVRRILDMLQLIDVQGQQPQVSIVPIRFADAKWISEKVNEILRANSSSGGSAQGFKIMPDERSNSVIVFGPPRLIEDVSNLVKKFDFEIEGSSQASIHVRPLDFADAKKIASTLSSLASGNKNQTRRPPVFNGGVGGVPLNAPKPNEAPDVAELSGDVKITADESTNSLLVTGSKAAYNAVNSIVRKLDIKRSQVFVEADILDISVNNNFSFSTSIFGGAKAGENNVITTWQAAQMAPLITSQATLGADGKVSDANAQAIGKTFADDMSIGILSGKTIEVPGLGKFSPGALIKTVKNDSNTRVLASPHILTSNNEESKFVVGKRIYFKTSDFAAATGVVAPKLEKEDVDLTLQIKPNISNSNHVTLKVDLESNSLGTPDPSSKTPTINRRKSSQTVTVKNSQTIVISGLVENQQIESFQKIPLLGDIPILGWLFRNTQTLNLKSNLVIFLTPHIIHGSDDLAAIYQQKIKERDEFMEQVYGSGFRDDKFYASLPKAEDGVYTPDALDEADKKKREQIMKSMAEESSEVAKKPSEEAKARQAEKTPVPANATIQGAGGSSSFGGSSDTPNLAPLPPIPGSPLPPPQSGSGDGNEFDGNVGGGGSLPPPVPQEID